MATAKIQISLDHLGNMVKMDLMLGYTDQNGAHTTMHINPDAVVEKLKWLCDKRYEAVIWRNGNRSDEVAWVYKHDEAGWGWCVDSDIIKWTDQKTKML